MVTETLSVKKCLDEIEPHFKDIMINLKKPVTWKTQLKISLNFISSKDTDEKRVLHSKSDNIGIIIYNKPNKVMKEASNHEANN